MCTAMPRRMEYSLWRPAKLLSHESLSMYKEKTSREIDRSAILLQQQPAIPSFGISTSMPPNLTSVRGEDVIKFKEKYEQYLRNVGKANRNGSNARKFPPCGIKFCLQLLVSLTELQTFSSSDTVTQVSDDHIKTCI